MNTKHTPGPWHIGTTGHVVNFDRCRICTLEPMPGNDTAEIDANARLIAAAPIMLDALQWYARECSATATDCPSYHMARAAIAAATGEGV
jgi:hypothetical protein